MLKITYFANVKDTFRPTIDQEILKSLKKIADVSFFDIKKFEMKDLLDAANKSDIFLFHGQIVAPDDITQMMMLERITVILDAIKSPCKKVMWFIEKVWANRGVTVDRLLPALDLVFFTDETFVRRMKEEKIFPLHPAAPHKFLKGKFNKDLSCDIAYVGNLYGTRINEYEFLKDKFGEGVKFFDNRFGQDLADLCVSAKVIVVPNFPFDDFCWSDRIYTILAYGGLPFHPRTYGLTEEGFIDGIHYVDYQTEQDFVAGLAVLVDKGADKMRKGIIKQGQLFVKHITYDQRIKKIIDKINEIQDKQ
jgi:hypothetical protein